MLAAVFSYNTFIAGLQNGWQTSGDNQVLLIQDPTGSPWGARQMGRVGDMRSEGSGLVDNLWAELEQSLLNLDHAVFYVGSYGAERAIELAAQGGLEPSKAVFVFCDCGIARKRAMLERYGFGDSRVIDTMCGGHTTMRQIFESLLNAGTVLVPA